MIRTPCFQCRGPGSVPGWGTKISQAVLDDQKYFKIKPKKKKKKGTEKLQSIKNKTSKDIFYFQVNKDLSEKTQKYKP